MAIFHYPFTDLKLSVSCPFLSLIISFINPDQGLPSTLNANTKKSFQDHKQSSSGAQMKSTELILLVGDVQTQEKHEQAKKKEMGKNPS